MKQRHVFRICVAAALLCAASASAVAAPPPPMPVADYDLMGWFGDALGNGPALVGVGEATHSFTVDGGDRPVLALPRGAGLRLSIGPLLPLGEFSIAIVVRVANTGSYGKIIDTTNLTSDLGVYTQGNGLRYYTAGAAVPGSFPDGALRQVTITRSADGTYTGYLDAVQQFSFEDAANGQRTMIDPVRMLHFLRDDDSTGNTEESDASLHRIRLFDHALAEEEVMALELDREHILSIFRSGGFEP